MARTRGLPGFYEKRKVLFGAKTAPGRMRETGKLFMDAGRYDDALEFFERCAAEDLVRQIAQTAMEEGDTPLYMRAKKVLKEAVSGDEWNQLAAAAEKAGRPTMAYVAYVKAGRQEDAARVGQVVKGPGVGQPGTAGPGKETAPKADREQDPAAGRR